MTHPFDLDDISHSPLPPHPIPPFGLPINSHHQPSPPTLHCPNSTFIHFSIYPLLHLSKSSLLLLQLFVAQEQHRSSMEHLRNESEKEIRRLKDEAAARLFEKTGDLTSFVASSLHIIS